MGREPNYPRPQIPTLPRRGNPAHCRNPPAYDLPPPGSACRRHLPRSRASWCRRRTWRDMLPPDRASSRPPHPTPPTTPASPPARVRPVPEPPATAPHSIDTSSPRSFSRWDSKQFYHAVSRSLDRASRSTSLLSGNSPDLQLRSRERARAQAFSGTSKQHVATDTILRVNRLSSVFLDQMRDNDPAGSAQWVASDASSARGSNQDSACLGSQAGFLALSAVTSAPTKRSSKREQVLASRCQGKGLVSVMSQCEPFGSF